MGAQVLLEAILPPLNLSVGEVLELKEGDFVPLDRRAGEAVVIKVSGVPMFKGILGESNGKKAVKITSLIEYSFKGTE